MPAVDVLATLTTVVGAVGIVWGLRRLAHADTAELVEIQHEVWEETREQLADCRAERDELRRRA